MPSSIRRVDVAGRDVTEYMQLLFRKSGYVFHTSAEKEVVRLIKEKTTYVALDLRKEEKEWSQAGGRPEGKVVEYSLPDGNKIKVWGGFLVEAGHACMYVWLKTAGWSGEIPSSRNPIRS